MATVLYPQGRGVQNREHSFKVRRERFKEGLEVTFFSQRVMAMWNELPKEVVEVVKITTFKIIWMGSQIAKVLRVMDQMHAKEISCAKRPV